ncbi:MAG: hypothetical protein SGBAC_012241 [Bacillariaceae sp.]
MTANQTEFTSTDTGKHLRFTVPLKEVVMLLQQGCGGGGGGGRPHYSRLEATRRARMYESLGITSNDEGSSGYEQEGPEDNNSNNNSNNSNNINETRDSSSIPHLESIRGSSEESSEDGYEGDNDYDALDNRSIGTTDSLVLTAERLPHLIHHPQRFGKAALRRSIMEEVAKDNTAAEEESSEAKDHVPTAMGLSFRLLRSQDSVLLTKERLEEEEQQEQQQQEQQEHFESTSETDDDSFFEQPQTIQTTSTSSSVGSAGAATTTTTTVTSAEVLDMTAASPRGIACTCPYDHFLPQKGSSSSGSGSRAQHTKKTLSDGSIAFPSLSPVDHKEEVGVTFE